MAARIPPGDSARVLGLSQSLPRDLPWLAAGLAGNVLLHGLMDVAPHTYPLPWRLDMAAAFGLIVVALALVRRRYILLFSATFMGGILPDLVDQGPGLLNQLLGLQLPERELFGFHSLRYVVSAHLGHEVLFSVISHTLVLGGCTLVLFLISSSRHFCLRDG